MHDHKKKKRERVKHSVGGTEIENEDDDLFGRYDVKTFRVLGRVLLWKDRYAYCGFDTVTRRTENANWRARRQEEGERETVETSVTDESLSPSG